MNQALSNLYKIYPKHIIISIIEWLSESYVIMSFDCATDNMGVIVISITIPKYIPFLKKESLDLFDKINDMLDIYNLIIDNMVKIVYKDKWKLTPDKKLKTSMTTLILGNLKNKIQSLILEFSEPKYAIYEFQMGHNVKTGHIQDAIIYQFVSTKTKLIKMGASLKNTIAFTNDLKIQNFYAKYSSSYKANKMHSEAGFKYWCNNFNIELNKKEKLDDMADAFNQIIAAIKYNKLL
jgi:hypothetical protein